MRQNAPQRRGRGRPSGRRGFNNSPNRSYDSSGPDIKIRGTAATVYDKYQSLGRDAVLSGDRVAAENFFQHAEHYYRLVQAAKQQAGEGEQRDNRRQEQQNNDESGSEATAINVTAGRDELLAAPGEEATVEVATDSREFTADDANIADTDETKSGEAETARATPMNPAELAAMSESGRRSRTSNSGGNGTGGRDDDRQIRGGGDQGGGDQGGDVTATADAVPRRQPRRRRRPAPDLTVTENESAPADAVEDVESN